jgi:hypothetical protein
MSPFGFFSPYDKENPDAFSIVIQDFRQRKNIE